MVTSDAAKYTYDFADATNELAESMRNMNESMMIALSGSKSWTILSRLTSGSGFWKIQNKIRAITDVFKVYDNVQKKAIENSDKFGKKMRSMATIMGKVPKNMNFDILRDVSEGGEHANYNFNKKYKNVVESETFQAIKTLFGNEKALSYAEEQITVQTEMIKQIQDKMQWQEDFAKGDIKTKATMIRDTVIKLATVYFGLASTLLKFVMITALPYILAGLAILTVAVPLIAIAIGIVLETLRWINASITQGGKMFNDKFMEGVKLLDLIILPLNYVMDILGHILKIIGLALKGDIWLALVETIKLVLGTIIIGGVILLAKLLVTGIALTMNLIFGGIYLLLESIVTGFLYIVKNPGKFLKQAAGFASGGTSKGGVAMVGESGPEMVYLPNGARVVNSPNTRRGGGATINVYVTGRVGASDSEITDIAKKVSRVIGIEMNRSINAGVRF